MRVSAIDTLVYTWRAYRKHWFLLICASGLYSSTTLIRYYVDPLNSIVPSSDHLKHLLNVTDDSQALTETIEIVTKDLAAQEANVRGWSSVLKFLSFIVSCWLCLGMMRICLIIAFKGRSSLSELLSEGKNLPAFLGGAFLIGLLLASCRLVAVVATKMIGVLLGTSPWAFRGGTCIGGVYFIAVFLPCTFFGWVLLDQKVHLFESFARSWKLMKKHRLKVALILCCVAFIAGATYSLVFHMTRLALFSTKGISSLLSQLVASWLGTAAALPLVFLSYGRLYRVLSQQKE